MTGFFVFIHCATCALLVLLILMQSGRGGGLTDSFASAESMFGAKTNEFMVRLTVTFALVFLVTSLSLAYLSAKKETSLIPDKIVVEETAENQKDAKPKPIAPVADSESK